MPGSPLGSPATLNDLNSRVLNRIDDVCLVIDALIPGCFRIAGPSSGYCKTTGYENSDVIGGSLRSLIAKAPHETISKSGLKNLDDYCYTCSNKEVDHVAETTLVQPVVCKDGSHFMGLFLAGLCEYRCRPYILIVVHAIGDNAKRVNVAEQYENLRTAFLRIRRTLNGFEKQMKFMSQSSFGSSHGGTPSEAFPSWHGGDIPEEVIKQESAFRSKRPRMENRWTRRGHRRDKALARAARTPDFELFAQRLDCRCILSNKGYTLTRREPAELQNGCLAFSESCMKLGPQGFEFSVRIDGIEPRWEGLPILGFTRQKPTDRAGLYPQMGMHQAQSILAGMDGNAFARDQDTHFVARFKRPRQDEVAVWHPDSSYSHPRLAIGDVLRCVYTRLGRIQLWLNSENIIDIDTLRTIDTQADYYAVVDACFTATSLTVLATPSASSRIEGECGLSTIHTMESLPSMSDLEKAGAMSADDTDVATADDQTTEAVSFDDEDSASGRTLSVGGSFSKAAPTDLVKEALSRPASIVPGNGECRLPQESQLQDPGTDAKQRNMATCGNQALPVTGTDAHRLGTCNKKAGIESSLVYRGVAVGILVGSVCLCVWKAKRASKTQ